MDLGKSVVIKGELSGSEDLTLHGQMEGSIRLPDHTLTIGPHADIKAQISRQGRGEPGRGRRQCDGWGEVEIWATGSVTGDIVSPRLAIADGSCFRGRVERPPPAHL